MSTAGIEITELLATSNQSRLDITVRILSYRNNLAEYLVLNIDNLVQNLIYNTGCLVIDTSYRLLNTILDSLEAIDVPEESFEHKRGVALTRVLDGLVIFQEQFDRDGRYTDQLNMILESFDTCDDKAETASEQAMNALYHCVILASLLAQEHCTTQNMVNQVKKETAAFQAGDEAAADLSAQFVNGGESLLRMLTAIASMRDDGSYAENIQTISEDTYAAAEADDDPMYQLANWLYGCTSMMAVVVWQLEG